MLIQEDVDDWQQDSIYLLEKKMMMEEEFSKWELEELEKNKALIKIAQHEEKVL